MSTHTMPTDAVITVAIAGITGSLGKLITEYLLAKPNVHIHGLCRTPTKLPQSLRDEPRLTVYATSSTDIAALRDAVRGSDVTICCYLGPNSLMVDGQKLLVDACIAEGVPRYIAGDWSMDFRKLELGQHPPKDPMKLVQAYLEDKEAAGQLKAVHVLNACFLERPWVGMWDPKRNLFKYWGTGNERWEFTTYRNAAQFTAEVAVDKDAVGWLSFRGDHVSIKEIAAEFQAVYGEEPGLERLGSLEDLFKLMHQKRDENPDNAPAWLGLFYTYYSINGQTTLPLPLDNERYPAVKLVTVRDFFAKTPKERLGKLGVFQS